MEASKDARPGPASLPVNGLIAVAVLAAGAWFVAERPLEGHRPSVGVARLEAVRNLQDIDARLWQDPLAAIAAGREGRARTPEGGPGTSYEKLKEAIERAGRTLKTARPVAERMQQALTQLRDRFRTLTGDILDEYFALAGPRTAPWTTQLGLFDNGPLTLDPADPPVSGDRRSAPPAGPGMPHEVVQAQRAPSSPAGYTLPPPSDLVAAEAGGAAGQGTAPGAIDSGGVIVLSVMVPGGPYSEDVEWRRRTRYAVLSALNARGFSPVDAERLGFLPAQPDLKLPTVPFEWFRTAPDGQGRRECVDCNVLVLWLDATGLGPQPLHQVAQLMKRLRSPDADRPWAAWQLLGPTGSDGLLAMIDEVRHNAAFEKTARQLNDGALRVYSPTATVPDGVFVDLLGQHGESLERALERRGLLLIRTIGTDDTLADAVKRELRLRGVATGRWIDGAERARRERARAEARAQLDREGRQPTLAEQTAWERERQLEMASLRDCSPNYEQRLGSSELPSHVALVAEWDTLYGRALRDAYAAREDRDGYCMHAFHYQRGLDGQMPAGAGGAGAANGGGGASGSGAGSGGAPNDPYGVDLGAALRGLGSRPGDVGDQRRRDGTPVERAEGQSQFDYLRRIAAALQARDRALRADGGRGLRAVGVLGNDVHDKLLVLQALRTALPEAVFFTTDLDARLFHPQELDWTRNLVVVSHYGLQLRDTLQAGTPPFRSSYQTAHYLASLIALNDALLAFPNEGRASDDDLADARDLTWFRMFGPSEERRVGQALSQHWLRPARVYEIGRSGPYDYSRTLDELGVPCRLRDLYGCDRVHPLPDRRAPAWPTWAVASGASALIALGWGAWLALPRNRRGRPQPMLALKLGLRRVPGLQTPLRRGLALLAALALLNLALPWWLAQRWPAIADWLTADGKPFLLTEGLSLWPSELLRLATIALSLYLIVRAGARLRTNLDGLSRQLRFGPVRHRLRRERQAAEAHMPWWQRLGAAYSYRLAVRWPARGRLAVDPASTRTGLRPSAEAFWTAYLVRSRDAARWLRGGAVLVVLGGIGWIAIQAAGGLPPPPIRGPHGLLVHQWLGALATLTTLLLLFYVCDAAILCIGFVRGLRRQRLSWPRSALDHFRTQLGLPDEWLDLWADLVFIGERTACVGRLVYYPFLALSLLLLSRSSSFDHWGTPLWYAAPLFVAACLVLGCAAALRLTAEAARGEAIQRLRDALLRSRGATPPAPGEATPAQLDALLERVRELRSGAFAPFTQQPLLRALLLPLGTLGGTALIDAVVAANI